ncbi:hypothetical protein LIER_37593 [Lithospermum erythrorhizon]|uniref:Reverse transcriptase Ty1/copia-type domain-containing protein n=1 Tax=Lithospermum erythrorhizon TaxID=34254 RepID=A0AAV3PPA1_LITER
MVCKLRKSLYGLKQAPQKWYKKFDSFIREHDFSRTSIDHCVYVKHFSRNDFIVLLLYVDDMVIVGNDISKINVLKQQLSKAFEMKDLGSAKNILSMEIRRDRVKIQRDRVKRRLWLSQARYIQKVLARFNMESSKPVSCPLSAHFKLSSKVSTMRKEDVKGMENVPYASAVGSLIAIHLSKNPSFHSRSKHIKVRYHWVRDVLDEKQVYIAKVHTKDNGADMLTKVLPKWKHDVCCKMAGLSIGLGSSS